MSEDRFELLDRGRETIGILPALPLYLGALAIGGLAVLLFDDAISGPVLIVLLALLIVYCALRPADGWDTFATFAAPSIISNIANWTFDVRRVWVALPVLAFALLMLWRQDREDRRARADRGARRLSSAAEPPAGL